MQTGTERLFVAAWPSDGVLDALDEMPRPEATGVRWMPRENLHLTLLSITGHAGATYSTVASFPTTPSVPA